MECSTPQKEPEVLILINRCKKLVDEIGLKTSMLRVFPDKLESSKETEPSQTLLEKELNSLVKQLSELSSSYQI